MKIIPVLQLSILAVLIFSPGHAIAADPAPPHMTVDLRDGSRIVCQSLNENIRFRSAISGELDLPIQDIQLVDCSSNNSVTVIFAGCTNVVYSFADSDLHVTTAFGKVDLPVSCIVKITVAAQPERVHMRARLVQPMNNDFYDYPDYQGRPNRFAAPGGGGFP